MQREDQLLDLDLIEHFWQRIRELSANLSLQSVEPLLLCLHDDSQKLTLANLVNGVSPKYDQYLRDKERE